MSRDFNLKFYIVFILFISGSIFVNYQTQWWGGRTMQRFFTIPTYDTWKEPFMFGLFHIIPYLLIIYFMYVFGFKMNLNKGFWKAILAGTILISLRRGTDYYELLQTSMSPEAWGLMRKVLYNLYTLVMMFVPLGLMYWLWDKNRIGHFYGIQVKGVKFLPYWIMLGGMVPLIYAASFTESFLKTYPTYNIFRGIEFAYHIGIDYRWSFWIYEFAYIIDFSAVEIFFRGFLIFVMAKYLGKHAVLPMVAAYVWLHFGKPMGETIGSAFGGYILGVVALYSRNIWGGIFIHMGVAFLMDVFAYY